MSHSQPTIFLCRHGDTAWSPFRRMAGRTDIPLSDEGERNAVQLGQRLRQEKFDRVLVSPLLRARRTAELAGFAHTARYDARLVEWDFGDYEGKLREDILQHRPDWTYFRQGCPNGDTAHTVGARVDPLVNDLREHEGQTLIIAHSVILRILTARWLGQPATFGMHFFMAPASLSVLGYDAIDDAPVIKLWNDKSHIVD